MKPNSTFIHSIGYLIIFSLLPLILPATEMQRAIKQSDRSDYFIQNKGQWPKAVHYLSRTNGLNIWITNTGVVYDHYQIIPNQGKVNFTMPGDKESYSIKGHVINMQFLDANNEPFAQGLDERAGYYNYLIGNDATSWATEAERFGSVMLDHVYENIGLHYYYDKGMLRYDFHVEAGADIRQVRIKLNGHDGMRVNSEGELELTTSIGKVTHGQLYAYQTVNDLEIEVECRFFEAENGVLGMELGNYDHSLPVVIDPLVYSTYLGGGNHDEGRAIKVGQDGSVFAGGQTRSANFPTTVGAYDVVHGDDFFYDIFVSKLHADGDALVYSTFIGGYRSEWLTDMAIDNAGNVFIAGYTATLNDDNPTFPTTAGVFQPNHNGGADGIVVKLNNTGTNLLYSTRYGGMQNDWPRAITIDGDGNAYITGETASGENFPTTAGAYQTVPGGLNEAFVAKINPDATQLIYSTFLGGSRNDGGYGIAVDGDGNAYVAGKGGLGFPTTAGAFQHNKALNQNYGNPFVTKINATGTALIYSTHFGGSRDGEATSIAIDQDGNAIIAGKTSNTEQDFPLSAGSFYDQQTNSNLNLFVGKLNANGSDMVFSTFLGESVGANIYDMLIDADGNIAFTGNTQNADFPVTNDAFQSNNAGQLDAFLAILNTNASQMMYASYLGGAAADAGHAIDSNSDGVFFITGSTSSNNFPTTAGAFQTNYPSNFSETSAFVTKLDTRSQFEVIFNLDISNLYGFDHNNEKLYISGNFPDADWNEPGTNAALELNRVGNSNLYSLTLNLPANNYAYKFYRNAGWGNGEWAGLPNREATVDADATLHHTWGGELEWYNLQWPANGTIEAGNNFDVFAQAMIPNGVTGNANPANGLSCWIGYHSEDTHPSTWPAQNWIFTSHNGPNGNNDEFKGNLGSALNTPGTYYYASRFRLGDFGEYLYGGYNAGGGGAWDGIDNVSGELNVTAITWLGTVDANWGNAANWLNNQMPGEFDIAFISSQNHNPIISNAITINQLTIMEGSSLTIAPNGSLTVSADFQNDNGIAGLLLQSDATGTASLIYGIGLIEGTIQRHITGSSDLTSGAYHFVSVPLDGVFPPPTAALFTGSYLYQFDTENQQWAGMGNSPDTELNTQQGYMIFYPDEETTYSFQGPLVNEWFSPQLSYHEANGTFGWNLIPNPYPSAIDWNALEEWEMQNLNNAVYVWNDGVYATYVAGESTNGGSNIIRSGQAFLVQANAEFPMISFSNNIRAHNNQNILKNNNIENTLRIRSTADGLSDEAVVRFRFDATALFDSKYDGHNLSNDVHFPSISTHSEEGLLLSINSLPLNNETTIIPLSFDYSKDAQVILDFQNTNSFNQGSTVLLEDIKMQEFIDLSDNSTYTFEYRLIDDPTRFKLHFIGVAGVAQQLQVKTHHIYASGGSIYIHIPEMQGQAAQIKIYDVLGNSLYQSNTVLEQPTIIECGKSDVLIIQVIAGDEVFTTKLINQ